MNYLTTIIAIATLFSCVLAEEIKDKTINTNNQQNKNIKQKRGLINDLSYGYNSLFTAPHAYSEAIHSLVQVPHTVAVPIPVQHNSIYVATPIEVPVAVNFPSIVPVHSVDQIRFEMPRQVAVDGDSVTVESAASGGYPPVFIGTGLLDSYVPSVIGGIYG